VTLATAGLIQVFDLANIIMLYLLAVVLITIRLGKGAGIFASFFSVAAFDFFFVAPRWSFSVSDTQYLFTFAMMLVVALIISNLTARLRYQADIATYREQRTASLYAIAKELASSLTTESIIDISHEHLDPLFQAKTYLLLPDLTDKIVCPATATTTISNLDSGIAQWVYDHQQAAGIGTNTLPASPLLYLPLKAPMRTRGVLILQPSQAQLLRQPEQQRLLDTFASQIALALERVHFVDVARDALVNMEGERLRNSLLSTISHDLRTPLTSLIAMASLLEKNLNQPKDALEITRYIQQQALRMNQLITNLLDMARLQTGGVTLNRQWHAIEETIGSAIHACQPSLDHHIIRTDVPPELPLVLFDAILIERVLCNLLENACKYTPVQSIITVSARMSEQQLIVSVKDNGAGLPTGMEDKIFAKFTRGDKESAQTGVGLGLAICQAIIEAHHGSIKATNIDTGGACFTFTLPASEPPPLTAEEPEDP
jgi:two-component system sensor histidine kinase KdpD